jgi:hypothetical protein
MVILDQYKDYEDIKNIFLIQEHNIYKYLT